MLKLEAEGQGISGWVNEKNRHNTEQWQGIGHLSVTHSGFWIPKYSTNAKTPTQVGANRGYRASAITFDIDSYLE